MVDQRHLDLKHTKLLLKFIQLFALPLEFSFQLFIPFFRIVRLNLFVLALKKSLEILLKTVKISVHHRNHADLCLHFRHCFVQTLDHLAEFLLVYFLPNLSAQLSLQACLCSLDHFYQFWL